MIESSKLRKLADLIDRYPTLAEIASVEWYGLRIYCYATYDDNGEAIPDSAAALMGEWIRTLRRDQDCPSKTAKKEYSESYMTVSIVMDGYKVKVEAARESVCKKIETGETETVTEYDYSAAPKVEVTRPVTRWECSPLITADET